MLWILTKALIAAIVVVVVTDVGVKWPRIGALVLSLPIVSILAFTLAYAQHGDLPAISRLARETVILVLIGLPFFAPIALAPRLHLTFWPAFALGLGLAAATISIYFALAPEQ
jgi:hypothetical protein